MSTLATLNVVLNGDIGGFLKAMKDAEGQSQSSDGLISRALGGIGDAAKLAGTVAVAGIGAAVGAAIGGVTAFESWANTLKDTQNVLGTTADETAGLVVAIRTVGGNVDGLTGQFAKFAKGALADGKSLTPIQQDLKDLGINIHEVGKQSTVMGTALPSAKLTELSDKLTAATAKLHDMDAAYAKAKTHTEMSTLNLSKQRDMVAALTAQLDSGGKTIARTIGADGPLKGSAEILQEVANKISKMPDGLEKTKLMTELFGKSGKDLSETLSALANGGLQAAEDKAQSFGLAIGQDGLDRAHEFGVGLETLKMAAEGFAVSIGSVLMPVILPAIQKLEEWAQVVMPQLRQGIELAFTWIQTNVAPIIAQMIAAFQTAVAWVQVNWPMVRDTVIGVFEKIKAVVGPVVEAISGVITAVFGAISTFLQTHGEEIKGFISTTWTDISNIVTTVVTLIAAIITTIFNAIKQFITDHGTQLQIVFDTLWKQIRTVVETAINVVKTIISTVMAVIHGDWDTAWNNIKNIVSTIWTGIQDLWNNFWTGVKNVLLSMGIDVQAAWTGFWGGIRTTVENIWSGIKMFIQNAVNGVIDVINGMIGGFNDSLGKITGALALIPHVNLFSSGQAAGQSYAQGVAAGMGGGAMTYSGGAMTYSGGYAGYGGAGVSAAARPQVTIIHNNTINDTLSASIILEQQRLEQIRSTMEAM
jgi:phage-related protein